MAPQEEKVGTVQRSQVAAAFGPSGDPNVKNLALVFMATTAPTTTTKHNYSIQFLCYLDNVPGSLVLEFTEGAIICCDMALVALLCCYLSPRMILVASKTLSGGKIKALTTDVEHFSLYGQNHANYLVCGACSAGTGLSINSSSSLFQ